MRLSCPHAVAARPDSVAWLCERYIEHVGRTHVRPDGTPTRHENNVRVAFRDLIENYGGVAAFRLHSSHIKALRATWAARGITRRTINDRVNKIAYAWEWAAEFGYVDDAVAARIRAVRPLRSGAASEGAGVTLVAPEVVAATLPEITNHDVADMVRFMAATGCRVGLNWRMPLVSKQRPVRHVTIDVNWWKSFVHSRLAVAMGDPGALSLFGTTGDHHRMLADHLTAEYRVRTQGRGREVDEWKPRAEGRDNHYLDCVVGAAVAASMEGVELAGLPNPSKPARKKKRLKLSELQASR